MSMYSSNVMVMRLSLKFLVESLGVMPVMTGGKESLGPPAGGMMLAQLV
jgi:hypothetical protein